MNFASFGKRFVAFIIDGLIIWLICAITIAPWFIPPLCIIVAALYHMIFETSPMKATPGKAIMDICVVKSDGTILTIKDSLIRFAVSFLSSALFFFGYLISLVTEKKQTLHDFVANTVVVDTRFEEKNYWKTFVDQSKIIFGNTSHPFDRSTTSINSQSLEELFNLYQKGILTEDEYNQKKAEFLKRL